MYRTEAKTWLALTLVLKPQLRNGEQGSVVTREVDVFNARADHPGMKPFVPQEKKKKRD